MTRTRRPRRPEQLALRPRTHGGKRKGAGRPRTGNAGVPHREREALASRFPVHVTLKLRQDAPRLRNRKSGRALEGAIRAGAERLGLRVVHYSIQSNHVHLVCEAKDAQALTRGLQGLEIRMDRALNRAHGRHGRVWADRYHARIPSAGFARNPTRATRWSARGEARAVDSRQSTVGSRARQSSAVLLYLASKGVEHRSDLVELAA